MHSERPIEKPSETDSTTEAAVLDLAPATEEIQGGGIVRGDCVELLAALPDESVDLVFADPPYNIGFTYDAYDDRRQDDDYLAWCEAWIEQIARVVKPTGAFWLAIGDEYAAELRVAAKRLGLTPRNWVVWYYTFGQNCTRKFNRSHAHLLHFVKDEERHTFNAADPSVRVPSARALVYGDRRANPTGRLPDDTWIVRPVTAPGMDWVLRPQDLREDAEAFHPEDDTWYFSRVAGTFKERQGFHGCQMPEQLLGRIVRVSSSPGDLVLDPFAGSGTTLAVAKKLGRRQLGFELSEDYVQYATERVDGVAEGDLLHGPADPVRSAPTTANGRRLKGHPMASSAEVGVRKAESETPSDSSAVGGAVSVAASAPAPSLRELTRRALVEAFLKASDGASLDWLLCRPNLQDAFHAACESAGLLGDPYQWNRQLLKLRKAGELKRPGGAKASTGKSAGTPDGDDSSYAFAAEIAWARTRAKHPDASLDDVLCDPAKLASFDREAQRLAKPLATPTNATQPNTSGPTIAELRWAALRLRKAAKTFAAEAKQYDYVAAKPIEAFVAGRLRKLTARAARTLAGVAGVYLVASTKKPTAEAIGYVGDADDLGSRLNAHLAAAPVRGELTFGVIPDDALPSADYRGALRWNLVQRLRPTLSIDVRSGV